jgi:hypothetical protein
MSPSSHFLQVRIAAATIPGPVRLAMNPAIEVLHKRGLLLMRRWLGEVELRKGHTHWNRSRAYTT